MTNKPSQRTINQFVWTDTPILLNNEGRWKVNFCVTRDFAKTIQEMIREYEAVIASLQESLRRVARLEAKIQAGVLDSAQLVRKPDAWNVADDIQHPSGRRQEHAQR